MGNETLADDVLRTIARANRWANVSARFEVPSAQLRLLALIEEYEPARITALAAADHSSQPGTTAQVNRLVQAGLAERLADASDGRAVPVRLTQSGRVVLARAREARAAILAPALDGFTAAEREELRRGMAVLERLLTFTDPSTDKQGIPVCRLADPRPSGPWPSPASSPSWASGSSTRS